MSTDNIYKKAARLNLTFAMAKGLVNVTDLFTLRLEDLDRMGILLKKEIADVATESLIKTKSVNPLTQLRFDIIKDVIETRLQEEEHRKNLAAKRAKRIELEEILSRKERTAQEEKSIEELRAELEALDAE